MRNKAKIYMLLNILLLIYSFGTVCSKLASGYKVTDIKFIIFYGLMLLCLIIYAAGWQQVIKQIPLTVAFSNKAITVVWGILWGAVFFKEQITIKKITGAALVIFGIIMYAKPDGDKIHG